MSNDPWEAYCYAYEDLDLKWYDGYEDQGVSSRHIKDFIRTLDIIDEVSLYLGNHWKRKGNRRPFA